MTVSSSTPRVRLIAGLLVLAVALVAVSRRPWLAGLAGDLVQTLGLACVAVAALGRVWTSTFIAGFKDATLVRTGPYAACRHPLYALSLLGVLGAGLATRSVTLTMLMTAASAFLHGRAMRREDGLLEAMHGPVHDQYRAQVPALWPDGSQYSVPEALEIRPRVYWKAFLDAGALVGAGLLILLADRLQAHGVTPTLLELP